MLLCYLARASCSPPYEAVTPPSDGSSSRCATQLEMAVERNHPLFSLHQHEQALVQQLAAEFKDSTRTHWRTLTDVQLEKRQQLIDNQPWENELSAECETWPSDKNLVVKDANGEILLVYRPNHHSLDVVEAFERHTQRLLETVHLSHPKADTRHTGMDPTEMEKVYGPGKFGTLHFACWFEEGKVKDEPLVSSETLGIFFDKLP
jgi:hypothetical protein